LAYLAIRQVPELVQGVSGRWGACGVDRDLEEDTEGTQGWGAAGYPLL